MQEWRSAVQGCARMEINKQRMEAAVHCCARLCHC